MPERNPDYAAEDAPGVIYTHPVTGETISTFQPWQTLKKSTQYWQLKYTANSHTCLVSSNIFIGDTDDLQFDWLSTINEFPELKFRFYRTFKGYRFFVVSTLVSVHANKWLIHKLFEAFKCDKLYVDQVWYNSEFAARLTPKRDRRELIICELVYQNCLWSDIPQCIQDALKVHDSFTLKFNPCILAI
jgi:hypothetical protein